LKLLVRRHRAPHAVVQRARIVLLARDGVGTEQIARQLGCSSRNVRKWKSIATRAIRLHRAAAASAESAASPTAAATPKHSVVDAIHISAATRERLGDDYVVESRGTVSIKGKGEMGTYLLTGRQAAGA